MNSPPLLSLCIPTYNRAALLQVALEALCGQIDSEIRPQVEVVISDNASPDDTAGMVERVRAAYPEVQWAYERQATNVGFDANICALLGRAAGEFLWILSDDDVLLKGGLRRVFEALRRCACRDALYLNAGSFVTDSRQLRVLTFEAEEDFTLPGRDAALAFTGAGLAYISSLVFRRSLIAGRDYTPEIGTKIVHVYVFLDALAAAKEISVIAQPLLAVRENNSGGYSYYEVMGTNFLKALGYAGQHGYTRSAVREARERHLRKILYPYIVSRRLNEEGTEGEFREGVARLFRAYGPRPRVLLVLLLVLVPQSWLRALRGAYRRGRRA